MQSLIRFACLTAYLISSNLNAGVDDDDDNRSPITREVSVTESSKTQNQAGIITQRIKLAVRQPEFNAYGTVLSLEPLLNLRQQYLAAQSQENSAEARYYEADQNLSRTRNLHQQDIVSTRRLQEQQAQWQNYKANLATSRNQQETILATSRMQWGDKLTEWFTQNHGKQAEQFLNHQAQLLQITLPANTRLAPEIFSVDVDERGRRDQAIKATLISPAPQVDPTTQGERYLFKSEGRKLPYGAHISVWIASGKQGESSGVLIPENAVVWHLGQAFVFIKSEDGNFNRRLLPELIPSKEGYFMEKGFKPGEEIVTTGAQTLLSQELKNLIPREDDD